MPNPFNYGSIAYQDMVPLNRSEMQGCGVSAQAVFAMAAKAQLIPVTAPECGQICALMPIVFSPVGQAMPIAISSFTPDTNPFVQEGKWLENTYIPASIRRYPFALAPGEDKGKHILFVDKETLSEGGASSILFEEDGRNSQILDKAIAICRHYNQQITVTETAVNAIEEVGLLVEKQLSITTGDGSQKLTNTFKIIDNQKYQNLTEAEVVRLHQSQALWLIHTHMVSMDRITDIARVS